MGTTKKMKSFYNLLMALGYVFLLGLAVALSSPKWIMLAVLSLSLFFFINIMLIDTKNRKKERAQRRAHRKERSQRKSAVNTSYRQSNIVNLYGDEYVPHN
jgi:ABC-type multidrug transport system fused ATPase/permease subunit